MKRIDRLVLKSYAGPMILTFLIALFILLMQALWLRLDQIVGKGLETSVILEFVFWLTLTLIPMALPLSTLLASIMTMGDMGESNELLALKSAGVSLQRVMAPLMALVFCISVSAFYISNNILPLSNLKMQSLLYDIRNKRPDVMIETGIFYDGITGFSLKIQEKDPKTNLLRKVMIYDHSKLQGNISVTVADSGYISSTANGKNLIVTLFNGNTYEDERGVGRLSEGTHPFSHREFTKQDFIISLDGYDLERTNEELFKGRAMMRNLKELNKSIDSFHIVQNVRSREAFTNLLYSGSFHNGLELDSIASTKARFVHRVDIDSLFATLTPEQKAAVTTAAVAKAESIRKEFGDEYVGVKNLLEANRKQLAQYRIERHIKFTLSVACIIFFFIGAPLGAIIRKGGLGMPVVVSLFLFIAYWVMFSTGNKLATQGSWNVAAAIWFPSVVLMPLGIFLTYKSTTDSALFNSDRYVDFFKKVFKVDARKQHYKGCIAVGSLAAPDESYVKSISRATILSSLSNLSRQCEQALKDRPHLDSRSFRFAKMEEMLFVDNDWLVDIVGVYEKLLPILLAYGGKESEAFVNIMKAYPNLEIKAYRVNKLKFILLLVVGIAIAPLLLGMWFYLAKKYHRLGKKLRRIVEVNNQIAAYCLVELDDE